MYAWCGFNASEDLTNVTMGNARGVVMWIWYFETISGVQKFDFKFFPLKFQHSQDLNWLHKKQFILNVYVAVMYLHETGTMLTTKLHTFLLNLPICPVVISSVNGPLSSIIPHSLGGILGWEELGSTAWAIDKQDFGWGQPLVCKQWDNVYAVHPKNYAYSFIVVWYWSTLHMSFRVASLTLGQSIDMIAPIPGKKPWWIW